MRRRSIRRTGPVRMRTEDKDSDHREGEYLKCED